MVLGCDWCHIFKQLVLLRVEPVRLIIYRAYSDTVKHLYGTHNVQLFSNARDSTRDGSKCGCNVSCRRQISCIPQQLSLQRSNFTK